MREPGLGSHISPKQRKKKAGGAPQRRDQCLTWINVCLSALGRFLAWRSASSHSFLTWERHARWNEVKCKVVLEKLFTLNEPDNYQQKKKKKKKKSLAFLFPNLNVSNSYMMCILLVHLEKKPFYSSTLKCFSIVQIYCRKGAKKDYKLHHT